MSDGKKQRGRAPGTLCRFICTACGEIEMVRGGGALFMCSRCREDSSWGPRYSEIQTGRQGAATAVARAIAGGLLQSAREMLCTDSGGKATEYDHRDYNKPLQVAAVCRRCNRQRGHAIPRVGYFKDCIDRGFAPFALKVRVARFLRGNGFVINSLDGMPKKLSLENWRVLYAEMEPQLHLIWPDLPAPAEQEVGHA